MALTPGPELLHQLFKQEWSSAEHARNAAKTTEQSAQINASRIPGKKLSVQIFCIKLCFPL